MLMTIARAAGFSHVGALNTGAIRLREEVRDMCAVNKCGAYGTNWSCPPACGTLDDCAARIKPYTRGLILQTTGNMEDRFDYEAIQRTEREHAAHMAAFAQKVRPLFSHDGAMLLGAGTCRRCPTCTYPDAPCRFPDEMHSSMEAYGMVVNEICGDSGIPYYYGPGTLTFVGCALFMASQGESPDSQGISGTSGGGA
jgi:predicted metal-binding protein